MNNADELINTLQSAKSYLEKSSDLKSCPVCEQTIIPKELLKSISDRLNNFKKMIALKKEIEDGERKLSSATAVLESKKEGFHKNEYNTFLLIKDSALDEVKKLKINWKENHELLNKPSKLDDKLYQKALILFDNIYLVKESIDAKLREYRNSLRQITAIKSNLKTRNDKEILAKENEKRFNKLTELHELVEQTRKDFLDKVLLNISNSIDRYYQKMHPDEKIGKIRCFMKSGGISSLEITGKFHSVAECPPAAYYSESHLDTLGICAFIALAKHYNIKGSILVFDDVLTSVDIEHLQRFMVLLSELGDEFDQIIITTHYRPWRERYRYSQGPIRNVDLIELNNWFLEKGISSVRSISSLDELNSYLTEEKYDRQITAMKGGILLESLLDNITWIYDCKLRRKANEVPTIHDLFFGIDKKLKKSLYVELKNEDGTVVKQEIEKFLDQLESTNMVRNTIGAHYNEVGMELPDSEVKSFGKSVKEFAEALICKECGEIPQSDRSGSYRECNCGAKKLYPLQQPK